MASDCTHLHASKVKVLTGVVVEKYGVGAGNAVKFAV